MRSKLVQILSVPKCTISFTDLGDKTPNTSKQILELDLPMWYCYIVDEEKLAFISEFKQ